MNIGKLIKTLVLVAMPEIINMLIFQRTLTKMNNGGKCYFNALSLTTIQIIHRQNKPCKYKLCKEHLIKLQNLLNRREFILEGSPMNLKNVLKHFIVQTFLNLIDTMTVISPTNLKNVAEFLNNDHLLLSIRGFVLGWSSASVKNVTKPLTIAQPFLNISGGIAVTIK